MKDNNNDAIDTAIGGVLLVLILAWLLGPTLLSLLLDLFSLIAFVIVVLVIGMLFGILAKK